MKKSHLLLIILFISLNTNAQDYRKYWSDGNLLLSDFQAKPTKQSASHLAYVLLYETDKKIIDNVVYEGVFTDAYIDKSLSYIHANLKDEHHLKYNQVIFNIVEIHKRKLQNRIFALENIYSIKSLFRDIKSQLDRKILDFQEEGSYGIDKDITANWLSKTNLELLSLPMSPSVKYNGCLIGQNVIDIQEENL